MGTFETPKYAYMVPSLNGEVPNDDIRSSTTRIYRVTLDQIPEFQRLYTQAGWTWTPIYGLENATDYSHLTPKEDDEDETENS